MEIITGSLLRVIHLLLDFLNGLSLSRTWINLKQLFFNCANCGFLTAALQISQLVFKEYSGIKLRDLRCSGKNNFSFSGIFHSLNWVVRCAHFFESRKSHKKPVSQKCTIWRPYALDQKDHVFPFHLLSHLKVYYLVWSWFFTWSHIASSLNCIHYQAKNIYLLVWLYITA